MPAISHETINTIIAALSLIVAIVSPFIVYHYLDPKLQELRRRPKLEVIKSSFFDPNKVQFGVIVTNNGETPATNITVVFKSETAWKAPPTRIDINPPSPHRLETFDDSAVVTLERALGKDQVVSIKLINVDEQMDVWLYSDQGEIKARASISGVSSDGRARLTAVTGFQPPPPPSRKSIGEPGAYLENDSYNST